MNRFLVIDSTTFVFCANDPRHDGYDGPVDRVLLEEEMNSSIWSSATPKEPERILGVNPANPKHYRSFLDIDNLEEDGFAIVEPRQDPYIVTSWAEYLACKRPC